jgi:hypothetical protein
MFDEKTRVKNLVTLSLKRKLIDDKKEVKKSHETPPLKDSLVRHFLPLHFHQTFPPGPLFPTLKRFSQMTLNLLRHDI